MHAVALHPLAAPSSLPHPRHARPHPSSAQVLLGKDGSGDDPTRLDRVELGCLMATCIKFGRACEVIERFRAADEAAGCPEGPTESPMGPELA